MSVLSSVSPIPHSAESIPNKLIGLSFFAFSSSFFLLVLQHRCHNNPIDRPMDTIKRKIVIMSYGQAQNV